MASNLSSSFKRFLPYVPAPIRHRVVPEKWSWSVNDEKQVVRPSQEKSLFLGVQNSAGQAFEWGTALRENTDFDACNLQIKIPGQRIFPADVTVLSKVMQYSQTWSKWQTSSLLNEFSHVLIESAKSIMGVSYGRDINREIEALLNSGRKVGFICHGSDVRSPSSHRELEKFSPFHGELEGQTARLESATDRVHGVMDRFNLSEFVSTPDLLKYRPNAIWLPTLINQQWERTEPIAELKDKLVVLHAPTNPALKGSESIRQAMGRLHAEGLIEYREPDLTAPEDMPQIIDQADIVIDQVAMGLYGVASLEAMSMGKIVIAQVWQSTREMLLSTTGHELPIVNATPITLEEVVRDIANDPDKYRHYQADGRNFVQKIHSRANVAKILSENFVS